MGFFDKIQDTISSAADQTKAKAQEAQLKRERKQKLEALGEQVFSLFASGRLAQEELAAACSEISELDGRIASIEEQASEAQAARTQVQQGAAPPAPGEAPPPPAAPAAAGTTCPSCGAGVATGGRFCPACGCEVGARAPEQAGAGTQPQEAGPDVCAPPPPAGTVKAPPPPPPPPGVEPEK